MVQPSVAVLFFCCLFALPWRVCTWCSRTKQSMSTPKIFLPVLPLAAVGDCCTSCARAAGCNAFQVRAVFGGRDCWRSGQLCCLLHRWQPKGRTGGHARAGAALKVPSRNAPTTCSARLILGPLGQLLHPGGPSREAAPFLPTVLSSPHPFLTLPSVAQYCALKGGCRLMDGTSLPFGFCQLEHDDAVAAGQSPAWVDYTGTTPLISGAPAGSLLRAKQAC